MIVSSIGTGFLSSTPKSDNDAYKSLLPPSSANFYFIALSLAYFMASLCAFSLAALSAASLIMSLFSANLSASLVF
jgi:hypothetical protein